MSKNVPTFSKEEFMVQLRDIANQTAESLVTMGEKMHGVLCEDELADLALTIDGKQNPIILIKTLLVAFGGDTIDREWNAEMIKPRVAKVKRIVRKRPH